VIQKHVQDQLAEQILAGKIMDGETVGITVGVEGLMIGDVAVGAKKRPAGVMLN
jgi:ATP-dependent Clp protease ATP-binding subunit ClpB